MSFPRKQEWQIAGETILMWCNHNWIIIVHLNTSYDQPLFFLANARKWEFSITLACLSRESGNRGAGTRHSLIYSLLLPVDSCFRRNDKSQERQLKCNVITTELLSYTWIHHMTSHFSFSTMRVNENSVLPLHVFPAKAGMTNRRRDNSNVM